MSPRQAFLHQARVYLKESRSRRYNPAQRGFTFRLLQWAGDNRRQAMALREPVQIEFILE